MPNYMLSEEHTEKIASLIEREIADYSLEGRNDVLDDIIEIIEKIKQETN